MSVTISQEARELQITERDIFILQTMRDCISSEIKLLECEIKEKRRRMDAITASLCMIQLSLGANHGTT